MYGGRCVERGTAEKVFYEPQHPYTWGLLGSMPRLDREQTERLIPVKGTPPSLINVPSGCAFHPRCPYADVPKGDITRTERPELREVGSRPLLRLPPVAGGARRGSGPKRLRRSCE